jgi:penicillin-binding protein 1A
MSRRPELIPGQRRRAKRRAKRAARRRRTLVILLVVLLAAGAAVTASLGGAAAMLDNCDLSELQPVSLGEKSYVYDSKGRYIGAIPSTRNRQLVALNQVSPWMAKATIAIEDRRFYQHGGVDFEGILRAAIRDIEAGRAVEGASTITQQLVRNLYPLSRERSIERKVTEACLAIKMSRRYTKDEILEQYLNAVYYGARAYGVQAAAQTYFSKNASRLTLAQAALLAGLTQAPSQYNPLERPDEALRRRNVVLRAMLDSGVITRLQYQRAVKLGLGLNPGHRLYDIERVPVRDRYFFRYVYDELVAQYGAATVRSGGLKIYTTLDRRLQVAAQQSIRETLYERTDPAAAVVSIEPQTGEIHAMVAEIPGRARNQFNLAAQARRQAGSTFKTFVLTAAVRNGVNPDETYYQSAPFIYNPDPNGNCEDGSWWCVSTYSNDYSGSISISRATLSSDNTVYAKLTLDLGPEEVARTAQEMGIQTPLPPYPSIGLGSIEVTPLEMASAYATLAAGGVYSVPTAIRKVELADGEEDTDAGWGRPVRTRVLEDWVAAEVTEILEENIDYGTGTAAEFGRPAAGKTGTTEEHSDAWFCGYTPQLSTTVWIGYPDRNDPMTNVHGISVAGGTFPAEIWRNYMFRAANGTPYRDFQEPAGEPVWVDFEGQYANEYSYDYDYGYSDDESEESDEEEEEAEPTDPEETRGQSPSREDPPPSRQPEPESPAPTPDPVTPPE